MGDSVAEPEHWNKNVMHNYSDYRWLRGFNIIPSWGARIEQAWWDYDGDRRDRIDGNGIDGQGFHAWFKTDGSLRAGLEFLREPPRFKPPWQAGS